MPWEAVSRKAQADLLDSLPTKWRIDTEAFSSLTDVSQIPATCGIMHEHQIQLTELSASELMGRIASRQMKAVEVLEAFAVRAAISHQLVSCFRCYRDKISSAY